MEHLISIVFIIVHCTQVIVASAHEEWNYDQHGKDWSEPCIPEMQSPIDLYPTDSNHECRVTTSHGCFIPRIRFRHYNISSKKPPILTNNGHSVSMAINGTINVDKPEVTGAFLVGTFVAEELHFHWGSANSLGSEHAIDGTRFDIEMHIVHRNKRYKTIDEAGKYDDGLAVLGIMISIHRNQTKHSTGLKHIFKALRKITKFNTQTKLPVNISLEQLLSGLKKDSFYIFKGSFTTPKCSSPITWIVFHDPLTVPLSEASKLWKLQDQRGKPIQNNFRFLQLRYYRDIYYSP